MLDYKLTKLNLSLYKFIGYDNHEEKIVGLEAHIGARKTMNDTMLPADKKFKKILSNYIYM